MKPNAKTLVMTLSLTALLLSGCRSAAHAPIPVSAEDSTPALMQHPEFPAAARVAPNFVKATFHRIHQLEEQIANKGK